jgi:replication factor A1
MSEPRLKVKDITTYSRRVNLVARIVDMGEPHEVSSSSNGQLHQVTEALIGDETGSVLLTLWDENSSKFNAGDVVIIDNGYAGTFKGRLRLNIGRYGTIEKAKTVIKEVDTSNNLSMREYPDTNRSRGRRY